MANGHLRLKEPIVSHFSLAKRDLAKAKVTHRGEALSICKLALAKMDLTKRELWNDNNKKNKYKYVGFK